LPEEPQGIGTAVEREHGVGLDAGELAQERREVGTVQRRQDLLDDLASGAREAGAERASHVVTRHEVGGHDDELPIGRFR